MTLWLPNTAPVLGHRFPLPVDRPFTTGQAVRAGVSRKSLTWLTSDGLLRRILKGVYVATQLEDSILLRAHALVLVVPPATVVTDETAGWLHGADVLAPNDHLAVPPISMFRLPGSTRLRNPVCVSGQRTFAPDDLMQVDGLWTTTPLRTAWDLGRRLHRDRAIGALDSLLRVGDFTKSDLVAGVERFARQRGVVQLRVLAPLADPGAESPGESTLRLRWLDCSDLPLPSTQVRVPGDSGTYRLDLGVPEIRYAAEYDGVQWHSSDADKAHDKARRTWLRERQHWTITVFERDNVYGVHQDAARMLREGITEARRNLGRFRP